MIIKKKNKKPSLSLMKRFNSLVFARNSKTKKKKKNMQFVLIWNSCNTAKHFDEINERNLKYY